jgi:NAD(P)H-dependent flavin oxidoreductase YrpB (nitropropane dioxygenase family)
MVGGGINNNRDISDLIDNGASYIVCGTKFEKNIC